jgi:Flp pilus assembly protein TadD
MECTLRSTSEAIDTNFDVLHHLLATRRKPMAVWNNGMLYRLHDMLMMQMMTRQSMERVEERLKHRMRLRRRRDLTSATLHARGQKLHSTQCAHAREAAWSRSSIKEEEDIEIRTGCTSVYELRACCDACAANERMLLAHRRDDALHQSRFLLLHRTRSAVKGDC